MITAHADVVGSLLRPPELLEARRRFAEGEISIPEFKRAEDRAVDWAISLQERAGLPVVTDGEMRRESFQSQMVDAVEGFGEHDHRRLALGGLARRRDGGRQEDRTPRRSAWSASCVAGASSRRRSSSTPAPARTRTIKVTLPSPSLYANLWSPELSREAYPPSTTSEGGDPAR